MNENWGLKLWHQEIFSFDDAWEWARKVLGFSEEDFSGTNVGQALNRYLLLFQGRSIEENILNAVSALEAIYTVQSSKSKYVQLKQNIKSFLDVEELFPNKSFKKIISNIYSERSCFAHGDKVINNPFLEREPNEATIEALNDVVLILAVSLRKLLKLKVFEIEFPGEVQTVLNS